MAVPSPFSRAVAFLFLLLWAGIAAASSAGERAEKAFVRHAPAPAWVLPSPPLPPAPDAPYSLRLSDVQFHVDDRPSTYVHRAFTARDAAALDALGNLELSVQPDYETLTLHRLVVHRNGNAYDRLDSADIRFLQRERGLEQGVYSGRVTVAMVVPDLRAGDTLEVEYTTVGANPVFEGKFMEAAFWDAAQPTAYRRVVLNTPVGRQVAHRLIGTASGMVPRISRSEREGRQLLVFEGADMPAPLIDANTPADVQDARWLQFSEYASWSDVDAWALRLFQADVAPAALDRAMAAARRAPTQEKAAVAALEFVQDEIRYLSLSLGENSHRPARPAEVLQRRYGDCKDKSLLLLTMLRALGIQADPVLVPARLHKGLDQYLPSPMLFDHAIVRLTIDGKTYFVDPTRQGQHGALASLGQPLAGADVLVVRPGATRLDGIPVPDRPERRRRVEQVTVTAMDQPPRLAVRSEYVGVGAELVRNSIASLSPAELRKSVEASMAKRYAEAQLSGDVRVRDDREHNLVAVESDFVVPHLLTETATGWKFDVSAATMADLLPAPDGARRTTALAVPGYAYGASYEIEVHLPDSFAMDEDSDTRTVDDPAFKGTRQLRIGKNTMKAALTLDVLADRVEPARMVEFDRKLRAWNELDLGTMRISKADMRAGPRPHASEEERLRAVLGKLDQAVAEADRTGREPGRALCERARVRAYLGQSQDAAKDALKAVKAQEQATELLACRGEVHLLTGRMREAEADLTRSIARGHTEPAVYFQRGMANLYLNRRQEALADFRLAQQSLDETERLGAAVMQASLGAAPATGGAVEDGANDWLRVALDLFAGKDTPEHLITSAMQGPRAGTDARLTAAYYFIGRTLAPKQPLKAQAYFKRAADKRALSSIYYHIARIELARTEP
jgi:transglutaminase-like putative cysteine protease/tetratricopeptide (TPR) repeat protein